MTPFLENLILTGEAKSLSFCSYGSALSSIEIPKDFSVIVLSVQSFPFLDLTEAQLALPAADRWKLIARACHYYEVSTEKNDRYGFIDRAEVSLSNSAGALVGGPIPQPFPMGGAVNQSVYWFLRGKVLILRVTTLPTPAAGGFTSGVPPTSEQEALLGYEPVVPVVKNISGFGDPTAVSPLKYVPDFRNGLISLKQTHVPRPTPDPTNEFTALQIPPGIPNAQVPYSFPVVNIQYVLIKNTALKREGSI